MPRTFGNRLARSVCASAIAIWVPLSAGAQDPFEEGPDVDEMRSEYEAAFNAGDAGRVAGLYAEDAIVLPPDYPVVETREGVESYVSELLEQRQAADLAITSIEDRQIDGAYLDVGTYEMTVAGPDGEGVRVGGDYASLVEEVEGEWLVTRHVMNLDMPR